MKTVMEMKELAPLIIEVVEKGGSFRLYPRGVSMLPLLREGIDSVNLGAVGQIKKGDIVFYLRDSGEYVLHRVVGVKKDGYLLCGDAQTVVERGIRREQVFAKATGLWRGDEYVEADFKPLLRYAKQRMRNRWLRRCLSAVRRRLKKK